LRFRFSPLLCGVKDAVIDFQVAQKRHTIVDVVLDYEVAAAYAAPDRVLVWRHAHVTGCQDEIF
jgi:hypothetical protein